MPDFLFSQLPDEPLASAAEKYAQTPSILGEAASGLLFHQPTSILGRSAEEATYDPMASVYRSFMAGVEPLAGLTEESLRAAPSPMIEPNETAKYAPDNKPLSDKPIPTDLARLLGREKADKIAADSAIQRYNAAHSWPTNIALDIGVGMADPLNLSTMLLPALGEETVAARLGLTGVLGRTLARGMAGAATGPLMQAPISALELGIDPDYGLRQAFYDLAFQAPLAAAVGSAAIGLPGEALRWMRGLPAGTSHAAMSAAIAQAVQGKPVDVGFVPVPPDVAAPVTSWAASQGRTLRRPEAIEGLEFLPPTIADAFPIFAERQKALAETGYSPGISQDALLGVREAVEATPAPVERKPDEPPEGWGVAEPAGMREQPTTPGAVAYERLPPEPMRLTSWLRQQGGVVDEGGDLASTLGGARFRPGLISRRGMSLDDAALAAWEAGYFPEFRERPTINDLRDAIAADVRGEAKYSERDREAVVAHQEALGRNAEIDRIAQETGIDPAGRTREQFWEAVRDHVSLEDEARLSEERFAAFEQMLVARGEENRYVGAPRSLEDMEREYRQEEASRTAGTGVGGAGRPGAAPGGQRVSEGGARPGRGGAGPIPARTERTEQGEQLIIPGAERTAQQAVAAREQQGRGMMRAGRPQEEPGGMFARREEIQQEFPELAAAERAFANVDQAELLPEEREVLRATETDLQSAQDREGAYQEAANCIKEAGG